MGIWFHYTFHGFREVWVTRTSSIEANIIQQLTSMMEVVLYEIFLDLHKVYNALESYLCLDILEGYGMGPR